MSFELVDLFPNANMGLADIGFLLGAGASKKAGYPLMPELTVSVLNHLKKDDVELLDKHVFGSTGKHIDTTSGNPNIEDVSDVLEAALVTLNAGDPERARLTLARGAIRTGIV
jgi:hypothetical protein